MKIIPVGDENVAARGRSKLIDVNTVQFQPIVLNNFDVYTCFVVVKFGVELTIDKLWNMTIDIYSLFLYWTMHVIPCRANYLPL